MKLRGRVVTAAQLGLRFIAIKTCSLVTKRPLPGCRLYARTSGTFSNQHEPRDKTMKCTVPSCYHDVIEGTEKCPRHTNERQRVRRYKLTSKKTQQRLEELTSVDYMASLKEEVAMATILCEQRINEAGDDPVAQVAAHSAINDSLRTIDKLVQSMHKHDIATGEVLSKPALVRLMGRIVGVVAQHLEPFSDHPDYPNTIDKIAEACGELIDEANNDEED